MVSFTGCEFWQWCCPSHCLRGGALRSHYFTIDTFIIWRRFRSHASAVFLAVIITARPFSVSAAVGFISIFGIAVMDDVLLSFYIRALWDEGYPLVESIILGPDPRLRAVMMAATVDGLGLFPPSISTKIGSRKPNDRWRLSQSADALRSLS